MYTIKIICMNIKVICLGHKIIEMIVRYRYNYKSYRSLR